MKYAILSDIHGNAAALKAVLDACKKEEVSAYLIAGDLMGYYYRLSEVLDCLKPLTTYAIRGNHEDMFAEWQGTPSKREGLEKKYGYSFARNLTTLSESQIASLLALPLQYEGILDGHTVLMCHGTPWVHDEYIYPDAKENIIDRLFAYNKDLLIMGHSHYPMVWESNGRIVVNPGSVGQSRDRKGGACWALWDAKAGNVSLRREYYDVTPVVQDCELFCPNIPYLREILTKKDNV